jgi:hypothetical protein
MIPSIITTSTSTVMGRIMATITAPSRRITTEVPPAPMKC